MAGIKITELVEKSVINKIWMWLWYHTMTQESAIADLREILLQQESQDTLCDVTTKINQDETLTQVPLRDILLSIEWYIEYAVIQIQELFLEEYSKAQETSTVYRDVKRHSKVAA